MHAFVSPSNRARSGAVIVLALVLLVSLVLFAVSRTPASAAFPIYYGPFHTTNDPDSGTCGNNWATDTFDRNFYVNPNNTQMFTETFTNASFVTIAGQSPGACESAANAGHTVGNGIRGTFTG